VGTKRFSEKIAKLKGKEAKTKGNQTKVKERGSGGGMRDHFADR